MNFRSGMAPRRSPHNNISYKETKAKRMKMTCPLSFSYSAARMRTGDPCPVPRIEPGLMLYKPPGVYSEYKETEVPPFSTAEKRFFLKRGQKASLKASHLGMELFPRAQLSLIPHKHCNCAPCWLHTLSHILVLS